VRGIYSLDNPTGKKVDEGMNKMDELDVKEKHLDELLRDGIISRNQWREGELKILEEVDKFYENYNPTENVD